MSRRARAIAFALAALACAGLAAAVTGGYRAEVAAEYGALRPVLVSSEPLPAGRTLRPAAVGRALEVRRVPERFVPPDALATPEEAIGRVPRGPVPAGSYLLASQLAEARPPRASRRERVGAGRSPVEIAVAGAGSPAGGRAARGRVDVVVTTEPGPGRGPGRTYVAVEGVRLLDLRSAGGELESPGPSPARWIATLALTRPEALRLIQAESFARQVRVIAAG